VFLSALLTSLAREEGEKKPTEKRTKENKGNCPAGATETILDIRKQTINYLGERILPATNIIENE
jgi:hypothetical protein